MRTGLIISSNVSAEMTMRAEGAAVTETELTELSFYVPLNIITDHFGDVLLSRTVGQY